MRHEVLGTESMRGRAPRPLFSFETRRDLVCSTIVINKRYETRYDTSMSAEISIACLNCIYNIRTVLSFLQERN